VSIRTTLAFAKKVAAFGRVVAEPGSRGDHQIAFGKQLAPEIGGEGAGDIQRKRVAVEQSFAEQRPREQRTRFLRQGFERALGTRPHRPPSTIGRSASAKGSG
jgi:hypothetical protein